MRITDFPCLYTYLMKCRYAICSLTLAANVRINCAFCTIFNLQLIRLHFIYVFVALESARSHV